MATHRTVTLLGAGVALLSLAAAQACNRGSESRGPEYVTAAEAPRGGFVAPLQNDASEDVVSWVDGQVVTEDGFIVAPGISNPMTSSAIARMVSSGAISNAAATMLR